LLLKFIVEFTKLADEFLTETAVFLLFVIVIVEALNIIFELFEISKTLEIPSTITDAFSPSTSALFPKICPPIIFPPSKISNLLDVIELNPVK
jgi:hypothetical protein